MTSKRFVDARDLIESGTSALGSGEIVKLPNFSLNDAMNAMEVMDPRMDTGVVLPSSLDSSAEPFDPARPLLPDEVSWLLDRALAAEMTFHTGHALAQTVYTVLHLQPSSLDALALSSTFPLPESSEQEALRLALRAGMLGLGKSTELVWQELNKGNVFDGEDFSGDRAGTELCDDWSVAEVEGELRWAIDSLDALDPPPSWASPLSLRLTLRLRLLHSLSSSSPSSLSDLSSSLSQALPFIVSLPEPPPDSSAHQALDPFISRTLATAMPLPALPLEDAQWTGDRLRELVEGLVQVQAFSGKDGAGTGEALEFLDHRASTSALPHPLPYIRSLLSSIVYSPTPRPGLFLSSRPLAFASSSYLHHALGLEPSTLANLAILAQDDAVRPWKGLDRSKGDGPGLGEAVSVLDQRISGMLVNVMSNATQNRGRQRRLAGKGISDWEELYEEARDIAPFASDRLLLSPYPSAHISAPLVELLPHALLLPRLSLLVTAIYAPLPLDLALASPPELAAIYFLGREVHRAELRALEELPLSQAWVAERQRIVESLAALAEVFFLKHAVLPGLDTDHTCRARFERRFKFLARSRCPIPTVDGEPRVWWEDYAAALLEARSIGEEERQKMMLDGLEDASLALGQVGRIGGERLSLGWMKDQWVDQLLDVCNGRRSRHPWFGDQGRD